MQSNFIFFGSSQLSVGALEALASQGMTPRIVVTSPDRPAGRRLELTETSVSKWVKEQNILREKNLEEEMVILKPEKFRPMIDELRGLITEEKITFALVASYGKILPSFVLDLLPNKVFNIHPSDLPLYRGPSPIESQVLAGLDTITISIMQLTQDMDAGDVWYKESYPLHIEKEGANIDKLEHDVGYAGGFTFSKVIGKILDDELVATPQDHTQATFTKKYKKQDGNANTLMQAICTLEAKKSSSHIQGFQRKDLDTHTNTAWNQLYRKYVALTPWPGVFFDYKHPKSGKMLKVKISEMQVDPETNIISITKLTPEGKSTQTLPEFENGFGKLF